MEARPPCPGTGLHLSRNLHFGLPSPIQYKPNRRRLILQAAFFPPAAVFGHARRGCHPAHKVQDLEIASFQCVPQTLLLPRALVTLISLCLSPPSYSVATARAPIRRTMLPNSRLVRWLSASISQ